MFGPATSTGPNAHRRLTRRSDIARLPDPLSGSSPEGPGPIVRREIRKSGDSSRGRADCAYDDQRVRVA
jgi:hypothetical protein